MWLALIIALPLLFVIGTVITALKEQRRLEQGLWRRIAAERRRERQAQREAGPDAGHRDRDSAAGPRDSR